MKICVVRGDWEDYGSVNQLREVLQKAFPSGTVSEWRVDGKGSGQHVPSLAAMDIVAVGGGKPTELARALGRNGLSSLRQWFDRVSSEVHGQSLRRRIFIGICCGVKFIYDLGVFPNRYQLVDDELWSKSFNTDVNVKVCALLNRDDSDESSDEDVHHRMPYAHGPVMMVSKSAEGEVETFCGCRTIAVFAGDAVEQNEAEIEQELSKMTEEQRRVTRVCPACHTWNNINKSKCTTCQTVFVTWKSPPKQSMTGKVAGFVSCCAIHGAGSGRRRRSHSHTDDISEREYPVEDIAGAFPASSMCILALSPHAELSSLSCRQWLIALLQHCAQ